jgi:hypothetical protein
VAFIIDIAGAKLRKARSPLSTQCCGLRSGAGMPSATLNRPTQPMGKEKWPVTLVTAAHSCLLVFHHLGRLGLGSYTVQGNLGNVVRRYPTFIRIKRGFGYPQPSSNVVFFLFFIRLRQASDVIFA